MPTEYLTDKPGQLTTVVVEGYQYGSTNQYIGKYQFTTIKEHNQPLPPMTTLVPPPETILEGCHAFWEDDKWVLKESPYVASKIIQITTPEAIARVLTDG